MCSSISEVYDTHECYVLVLLDLPRIAELRLHVSARTARDAMLVAPKLKIRHPTPTPSTNPNQVTGLS